MLKSGSIVLTIWCVLSIMPGIGSLVYILILKYNAPVFQMLFDKSELSLLDSRVLLTTNSIGILANACIVSICILILFIIWKSLVNREKWAFWSLIISIIPLQAAGYLSDSLLGNKNIILMHLTSVMIITGLGLVAKDLFKKYEN